MKRATRRLINEIEKLKHKKDSEIDLTDIPERTDWSRGWKILSPDQEVIDGPH